MRARLRDGAQQLGLCPSPAQIDQLMAYLKLLLKWNQAFNLTAVTDPADVVTTHLLDSLAVSPYLAGNLILDVGTGAGLPGIPLAILHPEKRFILLDSNGKKTRFLFQVKLELDIGNISIENRRVENFRPQEPVDLVITRAFSSLLQTLEACDGVTLGEARLLAMKGSLPREEIEQLPAARKPTRVIPLQVAGLDAERYLVEIPLGKTP